ncbi:non-ribosomal peptide synthetase [Streptomyces sp. NPDC002104]
MDRSGTQLISQAAWEGFCLSKQQEHVLGLVAGGLTTRTVAAATLSAPVDRAVLERAAHDVALAHESLRTAYRRVLGNNSTVLMVIEDEPRAVVSEASGDDARLAEIIRGELHADTGEDAVGELRLVLFTRPGQGQSVVLSAPRMSMDRTSVEVFFRDLRQAYAARLSGTAWSRDDVVQYADYAQWQVEEGTPSARQKESAADRVQQLAGLPPLNLPLEVVSDDPVRAELEWNLPASLAERLRARGAEYQGGLRGVLLTGWVTALWHAAGRPERLAVGTTLTRRPFQEMLTSIGQFETPMPIQAAIAEGTTLDDLLRAVGLEIDGFEQADESSMDPALQHTAGLPGFGFGDTTDFTSADCPLSYADLRIEPSDDTRKATLFAQGLDGGIRLTLRHQVLGMAEGGAEALLVCLQAALSALGGDLTVTVEGLAMLDSAAAHELVTATNPAELPGTPGPHWHRQVERTARRTPDANALRTDTRTWTYRELDRAANLLAAELAARGVRRGTLVGLCLERSDLALVAMLAIAKAGGGYVPLDPNLPAMRRTAVVQGLGLEYAVATDGTAADLPAGLDLVLLDAALTVCAQHDGACPDVETGDADPAYVIFTSGSTGTPKGVLVGHGQLAAYLDGVLDRLGLTGPIDSVALSTLGTDLGNTALFPPLVSGGELLVVPTEVSADAQALSELLSRENYDLLKITPSHLEAVFTVAEAPERLMPRQALVVGGEPFGWGWYNLFRGYLGETRLFNHYGPTETTVGVLCGQATSNDLAALASSVPLGTPMRHARAYVLDPLRRPLPAGLPGELWIGGSSVTRGYLDGTAEQQERFADDPFSPAPSARMYRTGDKVRFLPDRTIEFLGRVDRQIKLRGFRVELGEIEAVMRQHPRVTGSLIVEAGESTGAHLVGYLTDSEGGRGNADWLREFLAERLPEFMLPAHLVALDAFPLTSTGKIDAKMLPEPGAYSLGSTSYVEPRTETERRIAALMAQLLLLKRAGAEDDFFEIGGHSLLATQLVSRVRDEFKVNFKLRNLFEFPVVSELAAYIDQLLEKKADEAC